MATLTRSVNWLHSSDGQPGQPNTSPPRSKAIAAANPIEAPTIAASRPSPRGALDHAIRVIHSVCCLGGSASLIDDIRVSCRPTAFSPLSGATTLQSYSIG